MYLVKFKLKITTETFTPTVKSKLFYMTHNNIYQNSCISMMILTSAKYVMNLL